MSKKNILYLIPWNKIIRTMKITFIVLLCFFIVAATLFSVLSSNIKKQDDFNERTVISIKNKIVTDVLNEVYANGYIGHPETEKYEQSQNDFNMYVVYIEFIIEDKPATVKSNDLYGWMSAAELGAKLNNKFASSSEIFTTGIKVPFGYLISKGKIGDKGPGVKIKISYGMNVRIQLRTGEKNKLIVEGYIWLY